MDVNLEKGTITLFGKTEKIESLINKLSNLNGEQVYSLFADRGIAIPRKMNCMALTSVINNRLKTLHASELSKDYFARLTHYKYFSELQLYNLYKSICDTNEYFKEYRQNLFRLILMNFVGLNLTDGEINYLKGIKKLPIKSFDEYFQYISSMCQEQENTFDGQELEALQESLCNASLSQEIVDLGLKYGIEIPTTLKKNELIDYMKEYLKTAGELTRNLEIEIEASSVNGLNSLCRKYRIPMSSNMTKQELVSYLFYYLSQCEIDTTTVKRIERTSIYEPLEFTVDLSVFKGFVADDTVRIIRYENDEEDEFPLINQEEIGYIVVNTDEEDESIEEISPEIQPILEDNTIVEDLKSEDNDDAKALDQKDENEFVDANGNALNIDQIEAMINGEEIPKTNDIEEPDKPEPVIKEELEKNALPMEDVRKNELYGNEKINKYVKGIGRIIGFVAIGILIALIVAAIIYILI